MVSGSVWRSVKEMGKGEWGGQQYRGEYGKGVKGRGKEGGQTETVICNNVLNNLSEGSVRIR